MTGKKVMISETNTYNGELSCIKAKTKNMIKDSHIIKIIHKIRPVKKYQVELITADEFEAHLESGDVNRREILKSKTINKSLLSEEEMLEYGCKVIHQRHVRVFTSAQVDNNLIIHKLLIHVPDLDNDIKTGKITKMETKSHFRI